MSRSDFVSVTIVTYNSGRFIKRCLESVLDQKYPFKEIIVIDNNSSDGTIDILEPFEDRCRIVYNEENIGFAAAQNQAIAHVAGGVGADAQSRRAAACRVSSKRWSMPAAWTRGSARSAASCMTMTATFDFPEEPLVDSTGIYFTPNLRHLDRGSLQLDNGSFRNYEYVFGATAAAALYRREMIEDIAIDGEFFDNDFFVYREDADVAWRAQLMGWKCLYAPYAKGYHVRKALPGNRRALPAEINMHSVKNRFLLRMKNMTGDLYRRNFFSITARDAVVVGCCLLWEHTSLQAFPFLFGNWRGVMEKRREIMQPPPRDRRIHGQLVRLRAGQQARAEEIRRRAHAYARHEATLIPCASRYSERAAFPPATAVLKPSRKSFPHAWSRAAIASPSIAADKHEPPDYRGVRSGLAAHHSPQVLRHPGPYFRLHAAPGLGAPLPMTSRSTATPPTPSSPSCRASSEFPVALNVDGIERKRKKWNRYARAWYLVSEWLSTVLPHRVSSPTPKPSAAITANATESRFALHSLRRRYDPAPPRAARWIDWASNPAAISSMSAVWNRKTARSKCGRRSKTCGAGHEAGPDRRCALRAASTFARYATRGIRASSCPAQSTAQGIANWASCCFAYIHATEVGGTHPALIEAMGRGALVLYLDTPENREVCGDAGLPYANKAGLTARMTEALGMSDAERAVYKERALQRVLERYDWDAVTAQYEKLLTGLRK